MWGRDTRQEAAATGQGYWRCRSDGNGRAIMAFVTIEQSSKQAEQRPPLDKCNSSPATGPQVGVRGAET